MLEQPFAIPAIILFVIALPLLFGLIPRNRIYGVRAPRTLSCDNIWYPVNRYAALAMMIASCIYGLVANALPYHKMASITESNIIIHIIALFGPVLIGLILSGRYAHDLENRSNKK
ncbi:SdpI family protein [bacterium]|nr:SdpI family protein [bacterium]